MVVGARPQPDHVRAVLLEDLRLGSTPLPRDLCMALPSPSTVQPWVTHSPEGRALAQRAHGGEQAGLEPAAVLVQALHIHGGGPEALVLLHGGKVGGAGVEPAVQGVLLLGKPVLPPQWGQVKPWGRMSLASISYQALEPFSPKSLLTASMVSSVTMGLPQSAQ